MSGRVHLMFFGSLLHALFAQDISQAGEQAGMLGTRSSLVQHVWRIFDTLPEGRLSIIFIM